MAGPPTIEESRSALAVRLAAATIIYTDLDGTLLGPGGSIFTAADGTYTTEPSEALVAALRAGVEIVPVSGRNKHQLLDDVRILGLRDYIAEAGCLIVHERMEREWRCVGQFPGGHGSVYETIVSSGAAEILFDAFPGRIEYHTPWSGRRECSLIFRGGVDIAAAQEALAGVELPLKLIDNGIIRPRHHGLVGVDEIHAYHLLPEASSKPGAVRKDLELRGMSAADAIAIGDSASDLELSGEVAAFFLVANGLADGALAAAAEARDNVFATKGAMGQGWAEVVRVLLSARQGR